jgi:ABC-2 type transport system permease protein
MPAILQGLTRFVPATYYIDILTGIYLKNLNFLQLWVSFAVLTVMFLTLLMANWLQLRKEGL